MAECYVLSPSHFRVLSCSCIRVAPLSPVKLGVECGSWVTGNTAAAIFLFRNKILVLHTYKAKAVLYVPSRHGGKCRYSCTHTTLWCWKGAGGQHHGPAALPWGKRPGTHSTGGWVGFGAGLDGSGKSHPHWGTNQYHPAYSKSLYICAIVATTHLCRFGEIQTFSMIMWDVCALCDNMRYLRP